MSDNYWELLTALMPDGIEVNPDGNKAEVTDGQNSIEVSYEDDFFVVNGQKLHFEDDDEEIINTIMVPYILQELDGQRRL